MPGKHTCFILIPAKAAGSKAAKSKTSVTIIARTTVVKWFLGMRTGFVIMDAITSFRIKYLTYSLSGATPRMNLMGPNAPIAARIAK